MKFLRWIIGLFFTIWALFVAFDDYYGASKVVAISFLIALTGFFPLWKKEKVYLLKPNLFIFSYLGIHLSGFLVGLVSPESYLTNYIATSVSWILSIFLGYKFLNPEADEILEQEKQEELRQIEAARIRNAEYAKQRAELDRLNPKPVQSQMSSNKSYSALETKPKENRPNFYCEYCGAKDKSPENLLKRACGRHPTKPSIGKHKLYEGGEKEKYYCKYCGRGYKTIEQLVSFGWTCPKHPTKPHSGQHSPAL